MASKSVATSRSSTSPTTNSTLVHPAAPTRAPGCVEDAGVDVDADDLTLRTDEVGQQHGDVAGAAAEVEDLHPRVIPAATRNWRVSGP